MAQIIHGVALTQYSRNYSIITSLQRENYIMNCLGFSNNYFDKAVVRAVLQEISEIPISRNRCFGTLNLIYIGRSEKEIRKDC